MIEKVLLEILKDEGLINEREYQKTLEDLIKDDRRKRKLNN